MLVVPEKTIAYIPVIPKETILPFNMDISSFLKPLNENHKRDWFTPHFYRCLPLSIANMQGLAFSSPFSFDVLWNGENKTEGISFNVYNDSEIQNIEKMNHVLKTIDNRERAVNLATYTNPTMPISTALTEAIVNYIKG